MGVNCSIRLPDAARIQDVAKVMGALAGLPIEQVELQGGGHCARVALAKVGTTEIPEMARVTLVAPDGQLMVDGEAVHWSLYHFESDGGGRTLNPPSTAFWVAVGLRLVEFFGGELTFQDHEPHQVYRPAVPVRRDFVAPTDGLEWDAFQNRILAIKPITTAEWRDADTYAAYKIEDKPRG